MINDLLKLCAVKVNAVTSAPTPSHGIETNPSGKTCQNAGEERTCNRRNMTHLALTKVCVFFNDVISSGYFLIF